MRLNSEFVTHGTGGEQVIVATGNAHFAGLVRSNKTAADIVELLKNDVSKEQLVDAMLTKYDVAREIVDKDVDNILASLRSIGALDE